MPPSACTNEATPEGAGVDSRAGSSALSVAGVAAPAGRHRGCRQPEPSRGRRLAGRDGWRGLRCKRRRRLGRGGCGLLRSCGLRWRRRLCGRRRLCRCRRLPCRYGRHERWRDEPRRWSSRSGSHGDPPLFTPDNRPPAADNPAECPDVAPENPVGDCLGLPIHPNCNVNYACTRQPAPLALLRLTSRVPGSHCCESQRQPLRAEHFG